MNIEKKKELLKLIKQYKLTLNEDDDKKLLRSQKRLRVLQKKFIKAVGELRQCVEQQFQGTGYEKESLMCASELVDGMNMILRSLRFMF